MMSLSDELLGFWSKLKRRVLIAQWEQGFSEQYNRIIIVIISANSPEHVARIFRLNFSLFSHES